MTAILHLQLLGGFSLHVAGRTIGLGGTRLHALLAYLVLHPKAPQSRQQLASRFWPDVPEAQGRNNLRQLLHQLRQAWPEHDDWIETDARAMQWRDAPGVYADVIALERGLTAVRAMKGSGRREALAKIVRSYGGDLLPDCYDEWIVPHRDRMRETAIAAVDLSIRCAEEDHDHVAALEHARHLLDLDPLEERTYLRLMRLHALNGDHSAAARVYSACVTTLQRELGVAPGPELRDAHKRLGHQATPRSTPRERPMPLVGRAPDWQQLLLAWNDVRPSAATLALVTGEAGLGKTRLGEELLAWADAQGVVVARTRAYAAEGRLAFAPITGWLRSEPVRESLARLDPLWRTEVARLVSELLVEQPDLPRPAPLTEYWQRQQFFEAIARAVTGAAPALVLMLDDLQWCDTDTLEWLHYLLRFATGVRLLVIGTVRSNEVDAHHPLTRLTTALRRTDQLVEIPLAPLDAAETARLAAGIVGADLDTDAALRLFAQTEGNPLFVVETVRAGLPVDPVGLPPKVHAVITDRLNQLSPEAHAIAGLAATIGRAFSIDVVAAASELEAAQVTRALDELWQRRIARPDPDSPTEIWDFTHDRLREVAAAEQSPLQRQRNHRRIAEVLEGGDDLDALSAQIAAHYDAAREPVRAFPYYERAARVASRVFAYDEVQTLLRRALALLDRQPESSRPALELSLQNSLVAAIRVTDGWASAALELLHPRIVELTKSVGAPEQRAVAFLNLILFYEVRADLRRAETMLAEIPAALTGIESPALHAMALSTELGAYVGIGRFVEVETKYVAVKAIYEPAHHHAHLELAAVDFGVFSCAQSAHALWCRGHAEAALERGHQALTLARSFAHPFSKAVALSYLALLHQINGDDHVRELAMEARTISERHHIIYYSAWSSVLLAWVDATREPTSLHVGALAQRIDELTATGARTRLPYYMSLLAGAQANAGDAVVALRTVDEALEISAVQHDQWWDAELHRMRGTLLHQTGADPATVVAAYERAIATAREQQAGMLEQRARDSLVELSR